MSSRFHGNMVMWTACFCLSMGHGSVQAQERTEFPAEARQRYDQGRELRTKGQLDEAISAFEDAIKLGMEAFPRVHLQRASTNLEIKKYDAAIKQYTKFIEQFGLEGSCRY